MQFATQTIADSHHDLLDALQSVQADTQAQVDRFHRLMAAVKVQISKTSDEASQEHLGDIALLLHHAHGLLFGGAAAQLAEEVSQKSPEGDSSSPMAEFSTLLDASRSAVQKLDALLGDAEARLGSLLRTLA